MDATSWKAILKALQGGSSREEVAKDVLGSEGEVGKAYFDFLKRKYLGWTWILLDFVEPIGFDAIFNSVEAL